jgi:4-hydroxy-tetrahydrodipicolinate synthase
MASQPIVFRGAYTAIVTPFTPDASAVDMRRLEEQIRFQAAGKVAGIVACGTTGESPTLSDEEQHEVIAKAISVGRPLGLQVVAGTGSNNTAHAVELHRAAHAAGADASLQVSPYYNKPSQEGLYRHFMAVADSCDLPIMLYNIPGRCGVAIAPETVERLARHPNIRAIKEATGSMDSASEIAQRCPITILSGDDSLTLSFAACGSRGVVSVVSNLVPAKVQQLCDAFLGDRFGDAKKLHAELFRLCRGLLTLDTNPVPLKTAMRILGRDTGALRLPMTAPSKEVAARIGELLAEFGLQRLEAATTA